MSDVPTATKIAALEDHVLRLLSENVRLTNEAAEVRQDCANYRVRLERSETVLDSTRQSIITACTGSGCLNAHELRQALDRERERLVVLYDEVISWRAWCDAEDSVAISEPLLWQDVVNARKETDTRHALDAEKFVGGG